MNIFGSDLDDFNLIFGNLNFVIIGDWFLIFFHDLERKSGDSRMNLFL